MLQTASTQLQSVKVVNRHKTQETGFYIGRGSALRNRSSHQKYPCVEVVLNSREESIEWYRGWLREEYKKGGSAKKMLLMLVRKYMRGEEVVLVCSCKPLACHGDVVAGAIVAVAAKLSANQCS